MNDAHPEYKSDALPCDLNHTVWKPIGWCLWYCYLWQTH